MKLVVLGMVAVGVLGGGYYVLSGVQKQDKMAMEAEMKGAAVMEEKVAPAPNETMADVAAVTDPQMAPTGPDAMATEPVMMDEAMQKPDEVSVPTAGTYEAYQSDRLAMAATGDVVLFFKASWCPSCRALDAAIKASRSDIPAGLTILEVDYDTATALRQQYGVTTQHTLVQVAADGALIKKWSGGSTLASVIAQVQ